MVVKFQVERRPVGPTGKVYYGKAPGDYVAILSNPTDPGLGGTLGMITSIKALNSGQSSPVSYVPAGFTIPPLINTTNGKVMSHVVEVSGEPWLVHSSHHAIDSAIESAAPLAGAIGAENVRIVKVLSHSTNFKLN